ncbi:FUSC family protein [Flavobacterium sp. '19STA2R22 D10 B1']|uniref:FUSC family protein n=1 Tax=Flavobacterium aerium TaxID=3037261 RepID=UPI00278BE8BD|nr:FUSC family protein [Flavobacterium sp. '19STA2R22 D10 B1']
MTYLNYPIPKPVYIYMLKCAIGSCICYVLYDSFPQYPMVWTIVSALLVFSPEVNNKLAYDRIKANIVGAIVGLLLYLFHFPNIILVPIGVVIVILFTTLLRLTDTTRSALAAVVIIMIQEERYKSWSVALERVGCVILGCSIGLIITILFTVVINYITRKQNKQVADTNDSVE